MPKIIKLQPTKKSQSFNDRKLGWSKEPQWENNCSYFLQYFVLVRLEVSNKMVLCVVWDNNIYLLAKSRII